MVVFSFGKKRLIKFSAVSLCVLSLIAVCLCLAKQKTNAPADYATADELGRYSLKAENLKQRESFLAQFGLEVDKGSKQSDYVTIPKNWNSVYENYNKLQKAVGLDLEKYKGQKAERAVFKLENSEKYATLLILNGRVVGGHIATGIYGEGYVSLNGKTG